MNKLLLLIVALAMTVAAQAANSVRRVTQVTESVTISEDEDLIVAGTEPFGAMGSVNIQNTEHGVLILQDVKPSLVLKNWLSGHVFVRGEQACDGVNCQVKMYARGTIIMPYAADIRPLTVYAEKDFKGESLDSFGLENSGGYMNSLTDERMNNRIRSFRLKRGYMVTFATGLSGWGYSRCFIADTEDLEMSELPDVLDGRISSYRVFRWLDAGKKSLASDTNADHNALLGSTSCYGWGVSKDMLPDLDCVANHIYEDYPSSASIGMATATCHTKNNNEPGNRSDDHPQDVATVLANWQNMMRTGLRLGSETSHDGSWSHLRAFIDSIDARGWRCDFLDLHCYWDTGFRESSMQNYYNSYGKRPIWISEWVWGASWNNNGIFATDRTFSKANQQKNLNRLKEILPALENSPHVERYYYWNGEAACSRLLYNDTLSLGGEYYAQLESNIAYRKKYEKVPNVVYRSPQSLVAELKDRAAGSVRLSWSDLNGDMIDEIRVQRKGSTDADFVTIATLAPKDQTAASLSLYFSDTLTVPDVYTYRIADLTAAGTEVYSGQVSVTIISSQGTETVQYGEIGIPSLETLTTDFSTPMTAMPAVFMGLISHNNGKLITSPLVTSVSKNRFLYTPLTWLTSTDSTLAQPEHIPFVAINEGNYRFGDLQCEVGTARVSMTDTVSVSFAQPFPEGVTPVVLTELRNPTLKTYPICCRIVGVTHEGFRCILMCEDEVGKLSKLAQTVCYLAVEPGFGAIDAEAGLLLAAGTTEMKSMSASRVTSVPFALDGEAAALRFVNPLVFANLQTDNYDAAVALHRNELLTDSDLVVGFTLSPSLDTSRKTAGDGSRLLPSLTKETLGWVVVAELAEGVSVPTAITDVSASSSQQSRTLAPSVVGGRIVFADHRPFSLFTLAGVQLDADAPLPVGIYIVRSATGSQKVRVDR